MLMQDVIILTQSDPLNSSPSCWTGIDHRGVQVRFWAGENQRINLLTLQQQLLPCVVLVDQLHQTATGRDVSAQALISVLPMAAVEVEAVLAAGAAEQLIASATGARKG